MYLTALVKMSSAHFCCILLFLAVVVAEQSLVPQTNETGIVQ